MNYKDFNDYELLDHIYCCDEDANEIMIYKYRPLTVNLAKKLIKYCNGGIDLNDLIQEGLVGLNEAINNFREDKETNFGTYAKLCIQRRMYSVVKSTRTYKNKILNESISLEDEEDTNIDRFLVDNSNNPSDMLEENAYQEEILKKLNEQLTDLERQVFELKKIANEMDESAFITILDVSDIIGNHIKSTKKYKTKKSTTRIKEV